MAVALLLLLTAAGSILGMRINHHVGVVDAGIMAAEEAAGDPSLLKREDFAEFQRLVREGEQALRSLKTEVAPALWMAPILRYLPGYGGDFREGGDLLQYGLHLVRATDLTLRGLEPSATSILDGKPLDQLLEDVSIKLQEGHGFFLAAGSEAALAKELRLDISVTRLSSGARHRLERGDALSGRLDTLINFGLDGPSLLMALYETQAAAPRLTSLLEGLSNGERSIEELLAELPEVRGNLEEIRRELQGSGPLLLEVASAVGFNLKPESSIAIVDLAIEAIRHTELTLEGLNEVAEAGLSELGASDSQLERLLQALANNQERFIEAQAALEAVRKLRQEVTGSGLESLLEPYLAVVDRGLDVPELALRFALEGPKLSKEVIVIQEEMAILASLLSRQNFLELEPAELPGYRERMARLRIRMEALQLIWKELRPTYPFLKGQGLADGEAIERGLTIGILVAEATGQLLEGLERLLSVTDEGIFTEEFGTVLAEVLREWQGQSRSILDVLEEFRQTQEEGAYALSLGGLLGPEIDRIEETFRWVLDSSRTAHTLFGFDGPRTLIILGQDDVELRPTGGFIGAVVEITFNQGVLKIRGFKDSYDIDPPSYAGFPVGPPAFGKYMAGKPGAVMTFRDSNWWPDFPTSARMALAFYELTQPSTPDGVVAIDTRAIASLIDAIGDIRVPGVEGPVDGSLARDLFVSFAPYTCRPENVSAKYNRENRCFSEDLMHALVGRLEQTIDGAQVTRLLFNALEEKHMLIYSTDAELRAALRSLNWDGSLREPQGDYLAMFDWSAYTKAYDFIRPSLNYHVYISAGGTVLGELEVKYENTGEKRGECIQLYEEPRSACYWNFMRVYVPSGIELLNEPYFALPETALYAEWVEKYGLGDNTFEMADVNGHMEMAAFLVVPGGESRTLWFRYRLPAGTLQRTENGTWRYHLLVQKQPGAVSETATITVHFPPGSTLLESSPHALLTDEGLIRLDLELNTDQEVALEFNLP